MNINLNECTEIKDTLLSKVKNDSLLITKQHEYELSLNSQIETQGKIIENDKVINKNLNVDLEKVNKLYKREKIKTAAVGGFSVVLIGVILGLLFF